ncbi:MAG: hypothetical protein G01um101472_507 [Parcubacteria group bacterium Gr01-1014_72]|nr:MAG: hypothetical protein G01um101472_507 [Parcubacteria group bacterium Gr01-1014_72]
MRSEFARTQSNGIPRVIGSCFGYELEELYAKLLGGEVRGGEGDGGYDVVFRHPLHSWMPVGVQVKFSLQERLMAFLARALRASNQRGRWYIFVCVGEPPESREILLRSFDECGGWVGFDVSRRNEIFTAIKITREQFPVRTLPPRFYSVSGLTRLESRV